MASPRLDARLLDPDGGPWDAVPLWVEVASAGIAIATVFAVGLGAALTARWAVGVG